MSRTMPVITPPRAIVITRFVTACPSSFTTTGVPARSGRAAP
jgi:hypothetical protein